MAINRTAWAWIALMCGAFVMLIFGIQERQDGIRDCLAQLAPECEGRIK